MEKVITEWEGKRRSGGDGGGRERDRKRESTLVPAVLKSFQTSTVIPGYAI